MDVKLTAGDVAAYAAVMEKNRNHFHLLRLKVVAAKVRAEEVRELFKAVDVRALNDLKATGEAGADVDCGLDLEDAAFEAWQARCDELAIERGYIKPDGTYNPGFNASMMVLDAEKALIDFVLSVVPAQLRVALEYGIQNWKWREKFLATTMSAA